MEPDEAAMPDVTRRAPAGRSARIPARFETAADLERRLDGVARPASLEAGRRVRHAEYGEGTVAGVSGTGPRAVATVIFDGPAGTRRFILAHGALEPL